MALGDGLTALVVEDEPDVQRLIVKVMTAHGFNVSAANDGLEGLVQLERGRPDIILCDVMMPNLSGTEFLKAIKAHGESRNVPVIFVTAKTDLPSVVETMRAGAYSYLAKPFRRDELLSAVKGALDLSLGANR